MADSPSKPHRTAKPDGGPPTDRRIARGQATRTRVLDAAEQLFSAHGFDGVSIRDIASGAGVTLGVVGFHGGSKEELFQTLLARRVEPLSTARLKALADATTSGRPVTLRDIISAYVTPYLEHALGEDVQWRAYARLIANLAYDDRWQPEIQQFYDPVAATFIKAIRTLHPEAAEQKVTSAFVLAVSCMLGLAASQARIRGLAGRKFTPQKLQSSIELVIDFCTAGVAATLAASAHEAARSGRTGG